MLLSFPDVSLTSIGRGPACPDPLDGVVIATPAATHAELALPYIERGIATFIEKPMTVSVADAERIAGAAQRSGAPVFVGHIYLYNPAFAALLQVLPSLGAIRYVLCEGMSNAPTATASLLWEWLPHHLSMGRAMLAAEPRHVEAWSLSGAENPQAVASRFGFGSTTLVSITSWLSPVKRRQITIPGANGTLVFDDTAERKLALYGPDGGVTYPAYAGEMPLTCELQAFLDVVRRGQADRDHVGESTAIVRYIAGAEQALHGHRAVAL